MNNGENGEEPECAIAVESRPPRPKLREIARFWINSLRAAIYAGDAGAKVVGTVAAAAVATPEMGNLQSDGKRKNKKNRSIDTELDDNGRSKISKSLDELDQPISKVAFEKVQTPARKQLPPKALPENPGFEDARDEEEKEVLPHPDVLQAQRESDPAVSPLFPLKSSRSPDPWDSPGPTGPTPIPPPSSLPIETEGPPLLVTDSWHRANKNLVTPDVPTPPSQESSSDSVFTDPGGMVAESGSLAPVREAHSPPPEDREDRKSHFTVTRHKKIELPPASQRIGGTTLQGTTACETTPRRHSANESQTTESNVLRRVASLTLDRATVEGRANNRPRFVPEKLDFRLYEKFEGLTKMCVMPVETNILTPLLQERVSVGRRQILMRPRILDHWNLGIYRNKLRPSNVKFAKKEPEKTDYNELEEAPVIQEPHQEFKLFKNIDDIGSKNVAMVLTTIAIAEDIFLRGLKTREGQHLMNWLVSGIPDHLRRQLTEGDQKRLVSTICAHLVAAGVLKPLSDRVGSKEVNFTPDLMYEWSHQEVPLPVITSPGKLRRESWSPENMKRLEEELCALRCEVSRLRALINCSDEKSAQGQSTQTSPEGLSPSKVFVESGRFTASPTDGSINSSEKSSSLRFEDSRNDGVPPSSTLSPISEVETSIDQWTAEKVRPKGSSSPKEEGSATSGVRKSLENGKTGDVSLLAINLAALRIEDESLGGESTPDYSLIKISQDLSRLTEEINNLEVCDNCGRSTETTVFSIPENGAIKQPAIVESVNKMVTGPPLSHTDEEGDDILPKKTEAAVSSVAKTPDTITSPQAHPTTSASPPPPPPPPPPMPDIPAEEENASKDQNISAQLPPPPPPPPPPPMPVIFDEDQVPSSQGLTLDPGFTPPPPPPPPPMQEIMGPPPPPPPPPMPGMMGPPPPPPPMPGMMGPPPPPMPGMTGPPPPPPPPGFSGPPPPPPPGGLIPPPPPPGGNTPKPFPAPPAGGWNPPGRATLRKQPLNPVVPMKPLYWTRIIVPTSVTPIPAESPDSPPQVPLWIEIEEEKSVDIEEFANLFSRQVIERKPTKKKDETNKPSKIQPAKILDSKRSKMVGILEKSLHVDFSEVENAVYTLDTSVVNLEALKQIYEVRPSAKELEEIIAHEEAHPEIPLDRPEKFLRQLSSIPHFAERIACLMFQSEFQDAISSVSSKLTNLRSICEYLRNSNSLKKVIALILTLGNYMNGGNRMRGQADGFGLEILGKLKDVKSKVPGVTLLHYVARARIAQESHQNFDEPLPLPVPEPADVEAAATINFEDLTKELERLQKELEACNVKYKMVAESNPENAGPFKEKMEAFLGKAVIDLANEKESLQEARSKFKIVMQFYQYIPKGATLETADPHDFFVLWQSFCQDFKDIWKKEQQRLAKERRQEARKKFEEKRRVEKMKKDDTGLTARLRKLAGRK